MSTLQTGGCECCKLIWERKSDFAKGTYFMSEVGIKQKSDVRNSSLLRWWKYGLAILWWTYRFGTGTTVIPSSYFHTTCRRPCFINVYFAGLVAKHVDSVLCALLRWKVFILRVHWYIIIKRLSEMVTVYIIYGSCAYRWENTTFYRWIFKFPLKLSEN